MANQIQPSIGRIVVFHDEQGAEQPAVVTRVWTRECVNLQVLADCAMPYVKTSVVYSDGVETTCGSAYPANTWHWPARV